MELGLDMRLGRPWLSDLGLVQGALGGVKRALAPCRACIPPRDDFAAEGGMVRGQMPTGDAEVRGGPEGTPQATPPCPRGPAVMLPSYSLSDTPGPCTVLAPWTLSTSPSTCGARARPSGTLSVQSDRSPPTPHALMAAAAPSCGSVLRPCVRAEACETWPCIDRPSAALCSKGLAAIDLRCLPKRTPSSMPAAVGGYSSALPRRGKERAQQEDHPPSRCP